MLIDFENIQEKCNVASSSDEYAVLVKKVQQAKKIFVIGNGGLHYVASHMATDLSRLIPGKAVYSFDSVGFITSNANDHGFAYGVERPEECLVIGLSCSGNSANVVDALHWSADRDYETFMMSGQKSELLREDIDELNLACDYFHTVEVMCLMIFYDLIHRTENHCPSIKQEKDRLVDSPLRGKKETWEPM